MSAAEIGWCLWEGPASAQLGDGTCRLRSSWDKSLQLCRTAEHPMLLAICVLPSFPVTHERDKCQRLLHPGVPVPADDFLRVPLDVRHGWLWLVGSCSQALK